MSNEAFDSEISTSPAVALSIAGSDSGGGAGIQADLLTFAALGVFGTSVITALTAQNTLGVTALQVTNLDVLNAQIDAVLEDFDVGAVKTGVLATAEIVQLLYRRARTHEFAYLVVDPVMVASSGAHLLEPEAQGAYLELLPHVDVFTPNLLEAEILLGREIHDPAGMREAARKLCGHGAHYVLIKGGHLEGKQATDVFYDGTEMVLLEEEMLATPNVHGTGCTLSAAITANLALGKHPIDAIFDAKRYLTACLRTSTTWKIGKGPGPFNHFPGSW